MCSAVIKDVHGLYNPDFNSMIHHKSIYILHPDFVYVFFSKTQVRTAALFDLIQVTSKYNFAEYF